MMNTPLKSDGTPAPNHFRTEIWWILACAMVLLFVFIGKKWLGFPTTVEFLLQIFFTFLLFPLLSLALLISAIYHLVRRHFVTAIKMTGILTLLLLSIWLIPVKQRWQTERYFRRNVQNTKSEVLSQMPMTTKTMATYREYAPITPEWVIVFVSDDRPAQVHDTCADGGFVATKLERNWYLCHRDWN